MTFTAITGLPCDTGLACSRNKRIKAANSQLVDPCRPVIDLTGKTDSKIMGANNTVKTHHLPQCFGQNKFPEVAQSAEAERYWYFFNNLQTIKQLMPDWLYCAVRQQLELNCIGMAALLPLAAQLAAAFYCLILLPCPSRQRRCQPPDLVLPLHHFELAVADHALGCAMCGTNSAVRRFVVFMQVSVTYR